MENKRKNYLFFILALSVYISYFLSYFFGENSIGSGGYNGDLTWIWNNFDIFKNNNLIDSINHEKFYGNRTPLLYILNIYFNPFINDIDNYRLSLFIFFLTCPILLFFTLKNYFPKSNYFILFFISSFLLLSPYFRSSSVWGQEINYGIFSLLLSFFYFTKFKIKQNFSNFFLVIFFSSLCVYFDQKLLIVPLYMFLHIIFQTKISIIMKASSCFLYFIFSVPFIYLITIWGGVVPSLTQETNFHSFNSYNNFNLHFYHIGFASTLIALYLIPLILLKKKINFIIVIDFVKSNIFLIFIPFITYLLFYINYDWYDLLQSKLYVTPSGNTYGLGFVNKLGLILFDEIYLRKIFTYFAFLISWIIIVFAIRLKVTKWFLINYFFLISLILLPIMQEYFDPYIFLLSILMSDKEYEFEFKSTLSSGLFFLTALSFAIIYY